MSQLDMMKVEYKPVDKTRIKVLQVCKLPCYIGNYLTIIPIGTAANFVV